MNLRCLGTHVMVAPVLLMSMNIASSAQVASGVQASSATRVEAEMIQGRLSSTDSKAGDTVAVRLSEDVRSNGRIVLKKGTVLAGVVGNVSHGEARTHTQSMIEVEWMVPALEGKTGTSVSIALQSVIQLNASPEREPAESIADNFTAAAAHPLRVQNSGARLSDVVQAAANPALLSMPSVIAVDHQTSDATESSLDSPASGPLFKVGHGELAVAGGTRQSVDLFSHLNNDTVITSPSRNFQISSGAQMHLLVGIRK